MGVMAEVAGRHITGIIEVCWFFFVFNGLFPWFRKTAKWG
jgi:hypothetical protein